MPQNSTPRHPLPRRTGLRLSPQLPALLLGTLFGCYPPSAMGPVGRPGGTVVPETFSVPTLPPDVAPDVGVPQSSSPGETARSQSLSYPPQSALHSWKYVILHHTATDSGSVESIDRTHRERTDADGNPWRGIGYHFVVGNGHGMADGEVQPTFRWLEQSTGAHAGNLEYNTFGIGICLVGNFEEHPPTPAQVAAVKRLVAELKAAFDLDTAAVLRHGDVKATECPGRLFPHADVATATLAGDQSRR